MATNVVKRGGKPNRGGGRFPRGRGRGISRGRGSGRGASQPSKAEQRGHGGRKAADDYMADYDDGYDDDYEEPILTGGPNVQSGTGNDRRSTGTAQSQGPSRGSNASRANDASRANASRAGPSRAGPYRPYRGRGGPVKVAMQQLHMSTANQEMVKVMLKSLHGEDLEITSEDEYDELDRRHEHQYWMTNNQLQIEGATAYEYGATGNSEEKADMTVSTLAVNKLHRYGFHKTRSTEALQVCDGDLGQALENLLAKCFDLHPSSDTKLAVNAEILEQRTDEMVALEAIFEDRFVERIQHKVWILRFSLPYLEKLTKPQRVDKVNRDSDADNNICRFYLRGFCKFGRRCRLSHDKPKPKPSEASILDNDGKDCDCEVEIRFPVGNTYPHESPYIAFSSTNTNMSKHICLNITAHMMKEAMAMANDKEPSIFTVVSCLDDDEFLDRIVQEPPHHFSSSLNSKPWLNRGKPDIQGGNTDTSTGKASGSDSDEDLSIKTNTLLRMAHSGSGKGDNSVAGEKVSVKRSTSREEVRKGNSAELLRQNRRLVDDFKKRKVSEKYRSMRTQREKLPAWEMQDDILSVVEGNQVVVISGMTGCGKTTQVPQFILDLYLDSGDLHLCNIVCTQPRRISAMAVAERVAEERADNLGRIVGYQIRLEKVQSSVTRLLFCTTGIVLRRLEGDSTLDGITHVIIDEVHERSEESDFLLMYLRDMLPERPDLKVILMSATMNAQLFSDFFGNCPVLDIPGRTFPVDQYFIEDAIEFTHFVLEDNSPYARPFKQMNAVRSGMCPDDRGERDENVGPSQPASDRIQDQNLSVKQLAIRYPEYHKSTVKSLAMMDHMKINFDLIVDLMSWIVTSSHEDMEFPDNGAILVFMPGYAEIQTLFDLLQSSSVFGVRNRRRYKIIPLHSTLSSEEQHAVFSKPPEGIRKIVIATNIAETSITIDDVVFVIDTGKMKEKRYDPTKGMESLDTVWVSNANALQRKGRAGRVKSGVCFHLFTSHRFEHHFRQQPIPEIQRAPLEQIVLRIRMLNVFRYVAAKAVLNKLPEPPDSEAIDSAIKRLEDLGALDDKGELTPLGYHLGSLPVDVRIGKLMLFGAIFRCLDSALTIAACLSFKSPFVAPFGKKEEADERKLEFAAGNSDHLTMLKAYKGWLEARQKSAAEAYHFCQDNFLSQKSLQMLASMKQQFVELLSDIGFVREGISSRDVERAARGRGDGVLTVTGDEANCNSLNWKLVSAVLVGALYPNVIQVLTPESKYTQTGGGAVPVAPKAEDLKFKTKTDGYVNIHPSSVNFQVRHYESPYLVYHEKVKTSKIYIRDCTMVSVYPLLLFGGGSIGVDLSRGNFILSVDDGWIRFMAASHQIAELVRELRLELDELLADKIKNPHMDLCTCPRGSRIIDTIVTLISTQ